MDGLCVEGCRPGERAPLSTGVPANDGAGSIQVGSAPAPSGDGSIVSSQAGSDATSQRPRRHDAGLPVYGLDACGPSTWPRCPPLISGPVEQFPYRLAAKNAELHAGAVSVATSSDLNQVRRASYSSDSCWVIYDPSRTHTAATRFYVEPHPLSIAIDGRWL